MRRAFIPALLCGLLALAAKPEPDGPVVAVTGGKLVGAALGDRGGSFLGIPFARAPVGDLRWRPPMPVAPWTGLRPAREPRPRCLQLPPRARDWVAAYGSEDCLYLDVYTPRLAADAKLPVMVWIHGGGNRSGSARAFVRPDRLPPGVVLVAIQYRLDVLGFLSLPALTAESPDQASGNYGLMDQIAALTWLRDNIAQFGGDPQNVTIFGQSAGAQDVGLLLLSPLARGLFQRAIEQSGTAGFGVPPRRLAENEQFGAAILARGRWPENDLAALRAVPGAALLHATAQVLPEAIEDPGFIWLQAVVDGHVIPAAPADLLAAGQVAKVPLLIGTNQLEMNLFRGRAAMGATIERQFGESADRARGVYTGPVAAQRLAADLTFRCPTQWVAARHAAAGNPVWQYRLDRVPAGQDGPVRHSSDLASVFDGAPVGPDGETLQAYWANFARSGDPNGPGLAAWPAFGPQHAFLALTEQGPQPALPAPDDICAILPRP